jgi:endoglucanase
MDWKRLTTYIYVPWFLLIRRLLGCFLITLVFSSFFVERSKRPGKRKPLKDKVVFVPGAGQLISRGAVVRGDQNKKKIALAFTGDEFGDGGKFISQVLKRNKINASFFLTGNFYRNKKFKPVIKSLRDNGNYLGSHSDKHLLYCDWTNRDSLLVTKAQFEDDLLKSYRELRRWGISKEDALFFMPPFEWYNDSIAAWTNNLGFQLVNFTPGTRSNADYTYPEMGNRYVTSEAIYNSIIDYEKKSDEGLNGFILLIHIGTDPRRKDKFYFYLPKLISVLKGRGYEFTKIDKMLMDNGGAN